MVNWNSRQYMTTMLAELRLTITAKQAELSVSAGSKVIEQEVWTFPTKVRRADAKDIAEVAFHDAYDLMQSAVYGDDDS
jgi:hypothetical protein